MLDIFDRVLVLKNSQIFSSVRTEDLAVVARVLDEELFNTDDVIFSQGDYGEQMYLIQKGQIGISFDGSSSEQGFYCLLGPGECFGEMVLLDEQPRSGTAHALEETSVLSLNKEKLRTLIIQYPELALGMLKSLSLRLRRANKVEKQ
ncbi:MAG: cyclic nucleotide-binding domain-containing protein [Gammaproteobacteria bacterium]|nr:cyclic nucleotide-binding domain-containing protein [Gammaproteobacteria bacterium]